MHVQRNWILVVVHFQLFVQVVLQLPQLVTLLRQEQQSQSLKTFQWFRWILEIVLNWTMVLRLVTILGKVNRSVYRLLGQM
jgi:hypothetical protein